VVVMFFCYPRDRLGSGALRRELLEEHWSSMDQCTSKLIARGPTYAGGTVTGSVHVATCRIHRGSLRRPFLGTIMKVDA
jgi:hypothetical protein